MSDQEKIREDYDKWASSFGYQVSANDFGFFAWKASRAQADAEIRRLNSNIKMMCDVAVKHDALIAMQAEVLATVRNAYFMSPDEISKIDTALSASAESVAAWEAEKLEPLRRQVALSKLIHESVLLVLNTIKEQNYPELKSILAQAISHTKDGRELNQATAEAYDRELTEPLKKRIAELEAQK